MEGIKFSLEGREQSREGWIITKIKTRALAVPASHKERVFTDVLLEMDDTFLILSAPSG